MDRSESRIRAARLFACRPTGAQHSFRQFGVLYITVVLFWALLAPLGAQEVPLLAFPGAEGFGAASTGGRGGRVVKVTNLGSEGPGSLLAACEAEGPRIVVFEVSGTIYANIMIRNPQITIAGQTAPGAGITIEGMLRSRASGDAKLHDVVVRHLRVRPRRVKEIWSGGDGLQLIDINRLIVDHVSCSWASDENMDLCASENLTVQWCSVEESDTEGHEKGQHNFAMIMGYGGHSATVHHNLFAHHMGRAPLCGLEILDHRNNVIYNLRQALHWHPADMNLARPGKAFRANVIGNYFKAGPNAPKHGEDLRFGAIGGWGPTGAELYLAANYFSWAGGAIDPWQFPLLQGILEDRPLRAPEPWPAPVVETHDAQTAYGLILAHAGCLPRDVVSRRTVEEVHSGTGSWGRHDPPAGLLEGLAAGQPPADHDQDGMPDDWEREHGLDPDDPSDANRLVPAGASPHDRHRGYTYIEFYINELADTLVAQALASAQIERLGQVD